MKELTVEQLRDFIIRAHGMATENYVQSDAEMRKRIGALLESAIQADSVMSGFLGRGGPAAHCDALGAQLPQKHECSMWCTECKRRLWVFLGYADEERPCPGKDGPDCKYAHEQNIVRILPWRAAGF